MELSARILSDIVVYMKYARFKPELGRRETWKELITRNKNMHIKKYPKLEDEIEEAYKLVYDRKVLPSMRGLQFGGKPIEINPSRLYNCCYTPMDDWRAFSEIMFLLLGGSGAGYSVQHHHIDKLPEIKRPRKRKRRYLVGDSIEGWADAIKVLMKSYFFGMSDIDFDYSDIRPKGTKLVTAGGKAPGPQPLKDCIHNIRKVLDTKEVGSRLTSLEIHDINCFIADAVLSGGIRRCLPQNTLIHTKNGLVKIKNINVGDEVLVGVNKWEKVYAKENTGNKSLLTIKTQLGNFFSTPEHRWAVLKNLEGEIFWKEAQNLSSQDRLVFVPDMLSPDNNLDFPEWKYIPPKHSTISKNIKIPKFSDKYAWYLGFLHGDGYVCKFKNLWKQVVFSCAPDMPKSYKKVMELSKNFNVNPRPVMKTDGADKIVIKSNQLAEFLSQYKTSNTSIEVPDIILRGDYKIKSSYIAGIFDADGSVKSKNNKKVMPAISSIYFDYLRQLRAVLASLNIPTKISIVRPEKGNWKTLYKLTTVGQESLYRFHELIGPYSEKWQNDSKDFSRKCERKSFTVPPKLLKESQYKNLFNGSYSSDSRVELSFLKFEKDTKKRGYKPVKIVEVIDEGIKTETYDISVENEFCFVAEGMLVHNSAMISLFSFDDEDMITCKYGAWWELNPQRARANNSAVILRHLIKEEEFYDFWKRIELSNSGEPGIFFSNDMNTGSNPCMEISLKPNCFCNLCEVNVSDVESQEDLNKRVRAAAFIGTLQASYTNFHYLRDIWKRTAEKEALLGIGLTGIASNAIQKFDLQESVKIGMTENERVANLLGINKAARVTCIKPSGTSALVLGCSSGIHAYHSKYYIRRIRVGKDEAIYKYLKEHLPNIIEDDFLKPKLQAVISLPVKAPQGSILRNESALSLLERVKDFHNNWISPGHRKGQNKHNISCTVSIKKDEWKTVGKWMWENREFYNGLSVLPYDCGSYTQAPLEECSEIEYFNMLSNLEKINLKDIVEGEDNTMFNEIVACAGGKCDIV